MGNFNIEERISDKSIVMTPINGKSEFTLIWLHGYGVDIEKAKFPLSVERNNMPKNIKIVMPRPPDNKEWHPITGLTYWYDSMKGGPDELVDETKEPCVADIVTRWDQKMITRSVKSIVRLIHKEIQEQGGNPRKIFLGGFGLGANIAITSFLRLPETFGPLGGIFGASGTFCSVVDWTEVDVKMKKRTPILFYHGEEDILFERWYAQHTYKRL